MDTRHMATGHLAEKRTQGIRPSCTGKDMDTRNKAMGHLAEKRKWTQGIWPRAILYVKGHGHKATMHMKGHKATDHLAQERTWTQGIWPRAILQRKGHKA